MYAVLKRASGTEFSLSLDRLEPEERDDHEKRNALLVIRLLEYTGGHFDVGDTITLEGEIGAPVKRREYEDKTSH